MARKMVIRTSGPSYIVAPKTRRASAMVGSTSSSMSAARWRASVELLNWMDGGFKLGAGGGQLETNP